MNDTDRAIVMKTLLYEGGYVDNPDDHGGPTNHGVTIAALSDWLGRAATKDEVKALTLEAAAEILWQRYATHPGIDLIADNRLKAAVFDASVNSGPVAAIKMLQRALGLHDDGIIGPVTLAALPLLNDHKVLTLFLCQRLRYLGRIVTRNASQAQFASGWINRVVDQLEGAA